VATASDFYSGVYAPAPAFAQANERLAGEDARNTAAMQEQMLENELKNWTLPAIMGAASGANATVSGAPSVHAARAITEAMNQLGTTDYQTGNALADVLRNQFLIGIGVRVPPSWTLGYQSGYR
jgi:hypothetical protein